MGKRQEPTLEDRVAELEVLVELLQWHKHTTDGAVSVSMCEASEAAWEAARNEMNKQKKHERNEQMKGDSSADTQRSDDSSSTVPAN